MSLTFNVKCPTCGHANKMPLPWAQTAIVCAGCASDVPMVAGKTKLYGKKVAKDEQLMGYQPNFASWFEHALVKKAPLTSTELITGHANGFFKGCSASILQHYAEQFTKVTGIEVGKSLAALLAWAEDTKLTGPYHLLDRRAFMIGSMEEALTMERLKGTRLMDAKELLVKYKKQSSLSEKAMEYFCDLLLEGYGIAKLDGSTNTKLVPNYTKFHPFQCPLTMLDG